MASPRGAGPGAADNLDAPLGESADRCCAVPPPGNDRVSRQSGQGRRTADCDHLRLERRNPRPPVVSLIAGTARRSGGGYQCSAALADPPGRRRPGESARRPAHFEKGGPLRLREGDPKRLETAAHSLQGAAGCLGSKPTVVAMRIENLGKKGQLAEATSGLAELERELKQFIDEISGVTLELHA